MTYRSLFRAAMAAACAGLVGSCAGAPEIPAYLRPLPKETMMLLGKLDMREQSAIYIRIFKEESELEVWKMRSDGRFYHFKTYPICNWSGELGPKIVQGDRQAPEGFYTVTRAQMNPRSNYHLAFNLGFPNLYDKANGRTGEFLMVHGNCRSAGCYAMTDALIEEIYALAREAFNGGQEAIPVHAFPFRMTAENMIRYRKHPAYRFWTTLKEGYDYFETTRLPPPVLVCGRHYVVNAQPVYNVSTRLDPQGPCPMLMRPAQEAWRPPSERMALLPPVKARGPKMRTAANIAPPPVDDDIDSAVPPLTAAPPGFGRAMGVGAAFAEPK
jgi:murein L,D-transpeptidase YafK